MHSKSRRLIGGFIDPATLLTAGFLLVSLVGGLITTKIAQQSTENRTQAQVNCWCAGSHPACKPIDNSTTCGGMSALGCSWRCMSPNPVTPTQRPPEPTDEPSYIPPTKAPTLKPVVLTPKPTATPTPIPPSPTPTRKPTLTPTPVRCCHGSSSECGSLANYTACTNTSDPFSCYWNVSASCAMPPTWTPRPTPSATPEPTNTPTPTKTPTPTPTKIILRDQNATSSGALPDCEGGGSGVFCDKDKYTCPIENKAYSTNTLYCCKRSCVPKPTPTQSLGSKVDASLDGCRTLNESCSKDIKNISQQCCESVTRINPNNGQDYISYLSCVSLPGGNFCIPTDDIPYVTTMGDLNKRCGTQHPCIPSAKCVDQVCKSIYCEDNPHIEKCSPKPTSIPTITLAPTKSGGKVDAAPLPLATPTPSYTPAPACAWNLPVVGCAFYATPQCHEYSSEFSCNAIFNRECDWDPTLQRCYDNRYTNPVPTPTPTPTPNPETVCALNGVSTCQSVDSDFKYAQTTCVNHQWETVDCPHGCKDDKKCAQACSVSIDLGLFKLNYPLGCVLVDQTPTQTPVSSGFGDLIPTPTPPLPADMPISCEGTVPYCDRESGYMAQCINNTLHFIPEPCTDAKDLNDIPPNTYYCQNKKDGRYYWNQYNQCVECKNGSLSRSDLFTEECLLTSLTPTPTTSNTSKMQTNPPCTNPGKLSEDLNGNYIYCDINGNLYKEVGQCSEDANWSRCIGDMVERCSNGSVIQYRCDSNQTGGPNHCDTYKNGEARCYADPIADFIETSELPTPTAAPGTRENTDSIQPGNNNCGTENAVACFVGVGGEENSGMGQVGVCKDGQWQDVGKIYYRPGLPPCQCNLQKNGLYSLHCSNAE